MLDAMSAFPPTAYIFLPKTVNLKTYSNTKTITRKIIVMAGIGPTVKLLSIIVVWSITITGLELHIVKATPLIRIIIDRVATNESIFQKDTTTPVNAPNRAQQRSVIAIAIINPVVPTSIANSTPEKAIIDPIVMLSSPQIRQNVRPNAAMP